VNEAEFHAALRAHRAAVLEQFELALDELRKGIEAYVDERIADVHRRVDEVHERALRELTRLHERR
jgi:hypothetical protein